MKVPKGEKMNNEKILNHFYGELETASLKMNFGTDGKHLSDFSYTVKVIEAICRLSNIDVDYRRINAIEDSRKATQ